MRSRTAGGLVSGDRPVNDNLHVACQLRSATGIAFHGVDLHAGACAAGNHALQPHFGDRVSLVSGDMCLADLRGYDAITILDVLHYIPYAQQEMLLDQIRAALGPGGLLVFNCINRHI